MLLLLAVFRLAVERGLDVLRLRDERGRLRRADFLVGLRVHLVEEITQHVARPRRVVRGDVALDRGHLGSEAPAGAHSGDGFGEVGELLGRALDLDKGYDNPVGRAAAEAAGYIAHIRRIGEEKLDARGKKRYPARRWVVERTLSWLQGCRAILIRWDKKADNYRGLLQLACALVWYRRLYRLREAQVAPLAHNLR